MGLRTGFESDLNAIHKTVPIPRFDGTVDIYSFQQSSLLASDNRWSPRPTPQSYAAYNPTLARLNDEHLKSRNRPDNILFRVEPIDGRLPSLEDGLSWPTLFNLYYPIRLENELLYLRKRGSSSPQKPMTELLVAQHRLGEEVVIPEKKPLFAQIELLPTVLGSLASLLFKPPQLTISVILSDDTKRDFRFTSSMARSGFVISPLVTDTTEFAFLSGTISGTSIATS
jgi:hypothetical protein